MELDFSQLTPFWQWFPRALANYVLVLAGLTLAILILGWIISAVRRGPTRAFRSMGQLLSGGIADLFLISPRRVAALTYLAVKESIRRRVVIVIAIFILVVLFAGWFLDPNSTNPAQLYISFVMTATRFLMLLLILILCPLSIPNDLKNRTLHTIVTKPVRPSEIILGRAFGFAIIGTVLLLLMGTISYFFVERGLAHTHTFDPSKLHVVEGSDPKQPTLTARTSFSLNHSHAVMVEPDGTVRLEMNNGHRHSIVADKMDVTNLKENTYKIGPAEDQLLARVRDFGTLSFLDRAGQPAARGISVGKEWSYRSYIDGGTKAAAIWKFYDVTEARFPDGLPVALRISVFRTWKGIIDKGILGSLTVRNPKTQEGVEARVFMAKHGVIDIQKIDRELRTRDGKIVDIFKDMAPGGELQIELRCLDPTQCYGVAQEDAYLSMPDAPFFWNFFKGYVGIWMQIMLLIAIGMFFSTFLSGPVALVSKAAMLIGGLFHDFLIQLATGTSPSGDPLYGGGPFESLVRIFTQDNVISEMDPGLRTTVVQSLDRVFQVPLNILSTILPNFGSYDFSEFVANGFNIPGEMMLKCFLRVAAFLVPVFIASYFCFRNGEVAK